ncbi:hypothetical protein cand_012840 [Cryptosporidium andersoni]|uniref:Protein phosphatase n=1 Tax=Cryptosporidium andersoni TaxID=117008 RepID=A0A1J4MDP0_9CRYT|nr:hypothetical protein cand_012840 [Cryptosporidium andersoni]
MCKFQKSNSENKGLSEIFVEFLQGLTNDKYLGEEKICRHAKHVLRAYMKLNIANKFTKSPKYDLKTCQTFESPDICSISPTRATVSPVSSDSLDSCNTYLASLRPRNYLSSDLEREITCKFARLNKSLNEGYDSMESPDQFIDFDYQKDYIPSDQNTAETRSCHSLYRIVTNSTSIFPHNSDEGMKKLNNALREDKLRRISTHSSRTWPSAVTSHLQGLDIFLKIATYIPPAKRSNGSLRLSIGSCYRPHPSKIHYGGEDAHFYDDNIMCIADGVGEWANFGINPRAFADELVAGVNIAATSMFNVIKDKNINNSIKSSVKSKDAILVNRNLNVEDTDESTLKSDKSEYIYNEKSKTHLGLAEKSTQLKFADYSLQENNIKEKIEIDDLSINLDPNKKYSVKNEFNVTTYNNEVSTRVELIEPLNNSLIYAQYFLEEGYRNTKSFGSSTILVAYFDTLMSNLGISYLGDSGIIILRRIPDTFRMGIVYRSIVQQHSFNCPYQLSKLPQKEDFPLLQKRGLLQFIKLVQNRSDVPQDLPAHTIKKSLNLMEGDLVIIGTDGLFDNLFDYEICSILNGAVSPYEASSLFLDASLATSSQNIAIALTNAAFIKSLDPKAKTPFNKQWASDNSKSLPFCNIGGKLDDITVVAAWVVASNIGVSKMKSF